MKRNNKQLAYGIIGVGIGFIILNIILLENGLASINPFYSFFLGISKSIVYFLGISENMRYLPIIIMYLPVIMIGVYYMFKEHDTKEGVQNTNLYFEYRQWNFFWGWFFDGKEEVQNVLNYYNSKGWKVIDFEWARYFSHIGIFKTIMIFYTTILTLGVLSYWGGFIVIFEGVGESLDKNEDVYENNAFREWKNKNPSKTLNDYYAEQKII